MNQPYNKIHLITSRASDLAKYINTEFSGLDRLFEPVWETAHTATSYYTRTNDENGNYTYEFKLPGYKKEEVKVEVDNELLCITADSKIRGKTTYTVSNNTFDPERIDASLEDGILTIKLAKPEKEKSKTIIVK